MKRIGKAGFALALALAAVSGAAQAGNLTAKQQLGKKLFFDQSLSHGGNQSCASCHTPSVAFTDPNKANATSAGSNPMLFGPRNAPSAMYMAYSPKFYYDEAEGLYIGGQFDDGRAATLEDQAKGPFVNAIEMGNADRAEVIGRLAGGVNATEFKQVFGANALDDIDSAYDNIAVAIADYERSPELSPFSSKFDFFLKGRAKLTAQERSGFNLFNDPMKGNCAACHISTSTDDVTPPLFTDFTYDNIGSPKNFQNPFLSLPAEFNPDGQAFLDLGLGGVVGDPSLYGAFKVTTLRNIAVTGPFGHNGYFGTLDQVIDFYSSRDLKPACADPTASADQATLLGCWPTAEFADTMNVEELGALGLTAQERADIALFLGTLTDGYEAAVPEPGIWAMLILGFAMVGGGLRAQSTARRRRQTNV